MFEEQPKKKKIYNPATAFLKISHYCAYQERSHKEVRNKLYEYGLHKNDVEEAISKLITDGFLNEERFAKAYAGGKFRIKKWGRIKIKLELKKRKISDYCIKQGMKEIPEDAYLETLKQLIEKKSKDIKGGKEHIRHFKIANYIASRGFENDLIWEVLKEFKA